MYCFVTVLYCNVLILLTPCVILILGLHYGIPQISYNQYVQNSAISAVMVFLRDF